MRCFVPIFKIAMNIRKLLQKSENIAKGTTGPGVDCFLKPNQQFGKSRDVFLSQVSSFASHKHSSHCKFYGYKYWKSLACLAWQV